MYKAEILAFLLNVLPYTWDGGAPCCLNFLDKELYTSISNKALI